jgi:error-prone DNA polymerase
VPILPPDVNRSAIEFLLEWPDEDTAAQAAIRVGLGRVKGLSERTLQTILRERERAPFLSLPDFLTRARAQVDEVEHLIQCGAFDSFDRTRPEMLWRLHLFTAPTRRPPLDPDRRHPLDPAGLAACRTTPQEQALKSARSRTGGWTGSGIGVGAADLSPGEAASLFPEPETPSLALPRLVEFDATTRGRLELELLGLTVRAHPADLFPCDAEERLAGSSRRPPEIIPCGTAAGYCNRHVSLRGWLAASRRVRTSAGRWMRFISLEDPTGMIEVVLFPEVYERWGHLLTSRGPFLVSGSVKQQMGAVTLHADRVW